MTKGILLAILLTVAGTLAGEYSGPKCLGPYCLNRRTSDRSLFKRLGITTHTSEPNLYCYQSQSGVFLYFETVDSEPHAVGDVFLSKFPNCMHMRVHDTPTNLMWKTDEGIGLGSNQEDVLRAYGNPTSQIPIIEGGTQSSRHKADTTQSISKLRIRGFRTGDKSLIVADRRLFYRSTSNSDDLRAAEFGIRDGKVSWMFLSRNE